LKKQLTRVKLGYCHVLACVFFLIFFTFKKNCNVSNYGSCHVSIIYVKNLDLVPIFVILSQFSPNLFINWSKFHHFPIETKFKFYINIIMIFLL